MNLLLLSNSSSDAGYLAHALPDIRELVASLPQGAPAVFVPYAGVTRDWDDYTALVASALASRFSKPQYPNSMTDNGPQSYRPMMRKPVSHSKSS